MEWVETTGRTIEEALEQALDRLGVHEDDAEYEVLEEPKVGLFGRLRGEARVRARVRPTKPRAKDDRRDRRRRSTAKAAAPDGGPIATDAGADEDNEDETPEAPEARSERPRNGGGSRQGGSSGGRRRTPSAEEETMSETGIEVPLAEQGEVAAAFLQGVVERFGVEATVAVREIDEDTIEVALEGDDLGLLIGPKGATLASLQELARTVVQRKTSARNGRLLVDVGGYRQRRKEALERFARSAAERVLATGARVVLEPMSAADRKIVHDTVNDIDGVVTTSEGEDPRRRVVLLPAPGGSTEA